MEEGDVVLCTVTKIEGTSVFVNIEGNGEGSIVVSEIAPGRIRNLRDYVIPNKKIVCKVLRIERGHIHLSLRRVTSREKQEVLKRYETEKAFTMSLKRLFPQEADSLIERIRQNTSLISFFQESKEKPELLDQYFSSQEKEKIISLLKEKEKEIEIKKEFKLKCMQSNGLLAIKSILHFDTPHLEIIYLAASRFVLRLKAQSYKEGNTIMNTLITEIEKRAKKEHSEFVLVEK